MRTWQCFMPNSIRHVKDLYGKGDLLRAPTLHDIHILFEGLSNSLQNPPTNRISLPTQQPTMISSGPLTYADSIVTTTFAAVSSSRSFSSSSQSSSNTDLPIPSPVQDQNDLPIPGIFIPNLGHKKGAWCKAVEQWEEGDPVNGMLPLRDWPDAWFTGLMHTVTGTKRYQRKIIAEEYKRSVRRIAYITVNQLY